MELRSCHRLLQLHKVAKCGESRDGHVGDEDALVHIALDLHDCVRSNIYALQICKHNFLWVATIDSKVIPGHIRLPIWDGDLNVPCRATRCCNKLSVSLHRCE